MKASNKLPKRRKILHTIILNAASQHIPSGRHRINTEPGPEEILERMRARDDRRSRDPTSPALQQMNDEITRTNEHQRKHGDSSWRHWTTGQTVPNCGEHRGNRGKIHRQGLRSKPSLLMTLKYQVLILPVTFTTDQVITGISNCSNTKAFGTDKFSIFHLNNLCSKAIEYLTALFNDSVTSCRIPAIWKSSIVIPITRPGKDSSLGTSYRPISLLCQAAKVMEAFMLPLSTHTVTWSQLLTNTDSEPDTQLRMLYYNWRVMLQHASVTSRGVSYRCTKCSGWLHAKCSKFLNAAQYQINKDWTCDPAINTTTTLTLSNPCSICRTN